MDNSSLAHTMWTCKYHIVFAPKYRRKIIYKKIREDGGSDPLHLWRQCRSCFQQRDGEESGVLREKAGQVKRVSPAAGIPAAGLAFKKCIRLPFGMRPLDGKKA